MKRVQSSSEEEQEELAIEIATTVKERDEQGNLLYPEVLTNPAFLMLHAPDAILEMLSQRSLALLNLIHSFTL